MIGLPAETNEMQERDGLRRAERWWLSPSSSRARDGRVNNGLEVKTSTRRVDKDSINAISNLKYLQCPA